MKDSLCRKAPLPAAPSSALLRRGCVCRAKARCAVVERKAVAIAWNAISIRLARAGCGVVRRYEAQEQLRSTVLRSRPGRSFRDRREYIPVGSRKNILFLRVPERTTRPRPQQPDSAVALAKGASEKKESGRVLYQVSISALARVSWCNVSVVAALTGFFPRPIAENDAENPLISPSSARRRASRAPRHQSLPQHAQTRATLHALEPDHHVAIG